LWQLKFWSFKPAAGNHVWDLEPACWQVGLEFVFGIWILIFKISAQFSEFFYVVIQVSDHIFH